MPSSEMRRSGWASAESPLHVFSLSLSGEDAQSRSVGGLGWRASFVGCGVRSRCAAWRAHSPRSGELTSVSGRRRLK